MPHELVMEVQLTVIDHLGINMYTSLPPVISELVANSWDADATEVSINIPETDITEDYTIALSDNGLGMSFEEVNAAYLKIGRNRRADLNTDLSPSKQRRVLGRKGIGKLSVFGVAQSVVVDSVKSGMEVRFELDLDAIRSTRDGAYKPSFTESATTRNSGVTVQLKRLKRRNRISVDTIRRGLAQRFSVIGPDFSVKINGVPITPEERNLSARAEYVWPIDVEIAAGTGWKVKGWIGTLPNTVRGDVERGIVLMARGKLVQTPTLFDVSGGKELAYAYMVGELDCEFVDDAQDLVGTHRGSIVWESAEGQALREWGQKTLKQISQQWADQRIAKREVVIRQNPEIKKWLETLSRPEAKVAEKTIRAITVDDNLPEERALELANFMKESFQLQAFRELAAEISDTPTALDTQLLALFKDWQVLEAREVMRLFEGRLATIRKFEEYIKTDAREVPTIHKFFKEFPWVLDARWTDFEDEVTYSKALSERFPDADLPEKERRIDFICIGFGDTVHVVELKRPGYNIKKKDLDQIRDYVVFVKTMLGNDRSHDYTSASGYLICGGISRSPEVNELVDLNRQLRIYTRRYSDLLAAAERLHRVFIEKYKELNLTPGAREVEQV